IDNIVGILHVKDLIHAFSVAHPADFDLKNFIREPYFVPESMRTDELFRELQKRKVHIAVVIDEYGGTAGIITIEDLIEEIVGNIFDEYDEEEKEFVEISENIYVVSGAISLDELEDHCEIGLPIEEYDTLSGFMVGQLGHIPEDKESSEIEFNHTLFKILEVEEKVIKRVQVTRMHNEEQTS
ncbi:MAG: transporter associated domain-containing protein, partial [Erysipelotrichaceae bacterium]